MHAKCMYVIAMQLTDDTNELLCMYYTKFKYLYSEGGGGLLQSKISQEVAGQVRCVYWPCFSYRRHTLCFFFSCGKLESNPLSVSSVHMGILISLDHILMLNQENSGIGTTHIEHIKHGDTHLAPIIIV